MLQHSFGWDILKFSFAAFYCARLGLKLPACKPEAIGWGIAIRAPRKTELNTAQNIKSPSQIKVGLISPLPTTRFSKYVSKYLIILPWRFADILSFIISCLKILCGNWIIIYVNTLIKGVKGVLLYFLSTWGSLFTKPFDANVLHDLHNFWTSHVLSCRAGKMNIINFITNYHKHYFFLHTKSMIKLLYKF